MPGLGGSPAISLLYLRSPPLALTCKRLKSLLLHEAGQVSQHFQLILCMSFIFSLKTSTDFSSLYRLLLLKAHPLYLALALCVWVLENLGQHFSDNMSQSQVLHRFRPWLSLAIIHCKDRKKVQSMAICARSCLISEAKQGRARLVLGWGERNYACKTSNVMPASIMYSVVLVFFPLSQQTFHLFTGYPNSKFLQSSALAPVVHLFFGIFLGGYLLNYPQL